MVDNTLHVRSSAHRRARSVSAHHLLRRRAFPAAADCTQLIVSSRACGKRLVSGADESWPAGAVIVGGGRLHGRLAGSVEGSSVLVPYCADVAVRCSGEALSLPKPFLGGSQPP